MLTNFFIRTTTNSFIPLFFIIPPLEERETKTLITTMPKLKNGEMVVLKVSTMMRANTTTHLLRRRVRRRKGVSWSLQKSVLWTFCDDDSRFKREDV